MGQSLTKPIVDKKYSEQIWQDMSYSVSEIQGWRTSMEDAHSCEENFCDEFPGCHYFGVFDGHSGSLASTMCSSTLSKRITEQYRNLKNQIKEGVTLPDLDTSLPLDVSLLAKAAHDAFIIFDDEIKEDPNFKNNEFSSGTTALCAFVTPTHIIFANCGDSRGILSRDGSLNFQTKDHKPNLPDEKERIEKAGGSVFMDRVNGNLAVSRAIGDFSFKTSVDLKTVEQAVSPEPTITIIDRSDKDEFIVLACDGIWDVMSSDQVATFVRTRLQVIESLSEIANSLIDACLFQNSKDNMTALIIKFPSAPSINDAALEQDKITDEVVLKEAREILDKDPKLNSFGLINKLAKIFEERKEEEELIVYYKINKIVSLLDEVYPTRDKSDDYSSGGLLSDLPISLQMLKSLASSRSPPSRD